MSSKQEYRSGAETLSILQQLESKFDLFRHRFDGYSAWRLLRFKAATEIQSLPMDIKPDYVTWDWLKERLLSFIPDAIQFFFPRRSRYVFKTFSSALRESHEGRFKDIYFDDLLVRLGDGYKIETLNNSGYRARRRQALYPPAITTSFVDLLSIFLSNLGFPRKYQPVIDHIALEISGEPALRLLSAKRIGRALRRFYWSKRLYVSLLKRIQPAYVMTADQNEYAIWAAARELGVPTLEFQHGLFPRHDPDGSLPASSMDNRASMVVSDRILLYGDFWLNEWKGAKFYRDELRVVGSPVIDRYRQKRRVFRRVKDLNAPCAILLTTQALDRERLIGFMVEFLALAQNRLAYQLFVKLHPGFESDKSIYAPLALFPNVHILLGAEEPSTFELQCMADFHVSISSASHYDSLGIGVPTIILPLATSEEVMHLVKADHAKLASTPQVLLDIVANSRDSVVPLDVSSFYYASNALENIQNVIQEFAGEG